MGKSGSTFDYIADVKDFCKGFLEANKIQIVHYGKIYPDGRRVVLCNHEEFLNLNYVQTPRRPRGFNVCLRPFFTLEDLVEQTSGDTRNFYIENIRQEKEAFKVKEAFCLTDVSKKYIDTFIFYTQSENILKNYFENQDVYDLFRLAFADKFEKALTVLEKNPLLSSKNTFAEEIKTEPIHINVMDHLPRIYHLITPEGQSIRLTWREAECVSLFLRCKTVAEIAYILRISPTTVETLLNRAKAKLKVYSRSALFDRLYYSDFKLSLFEYLLMPRAQGQEDSKQALKVNQPIVST